jgi:hypothetical protein
MRVEIRTMNGTVGEVELRQGRASPNRDAVRLLATVKVVEPGSLAVLGYDDGERYLRALPYNLAGTRVWATLIDDPVVPA